jgi:hypothetical protein
MIPLLEALRTKLPELVPLVLGISLKNLDVATAPWSSITLCLQEEKTIVLALTNPEAQADRLAMVLRSFKANDWKNLRSIDVSLTSPVLKFKNRHKPLR